MIVTESEAEPNNSSDKALHRINISIILDWGVKGHNRHHNQHDQYRSNNLCFH